jgi:hypothetical protein
MWVSCLAVESEQPSGNFYYKYVLSCSGLDLAASGVRGSVQVVSLWQPELYVSFPLSWVRAHGTRPGLQAYLANAVAVWAPCSSAAKVLHAISKRRVWSVPVLLSTLGAGAIVDLTVQPFERLPPPQLEVPGIAIATGTTQSSTLQVPPGGTQTKGSAAPQLQVEAPQAASVSPASLSDQACMRPRGASR